jgi:transmembrane sensor
MQVQRQIDKLLAQRAAEWIEILKTSNERDRAEFVQWLRQSKLHVEQYLELVAIDQEIRKLGAGRSEDVDALLARIAPNVFPIPGSAGADSVMSRPMPRRQLWQTGGALAAAFALAIMAMWAFKKLNSNEVATAIGEQRTLALPDGSVVTMNALSALSIDYSKSARDIELESGEAVFKVAHDAARPFIVHTPTASVLAVGTQFNINQQPNGTIVSVLEGRVQVTPKAEASPSQKTGPESVSAGEEAHVQSNGAMSKRSRSDLSKVLAWRDRKLFFEETPLEDIVREFNRYGRSMQLRLEGIPAGTRKYGGVFEADDPESLADLLAREPDLIVVRRDGEILIRHK